MQLKPIDKIQYIPFRHYEGRLYYFSPEGIVKRCRDHELHPKVEELYRNNYENEYLYIRKEYSFEEYVKQQIEWFRMDEVSFVDYDYDYEKTSLQLRKAAAKLKPGDTYEDFKKYIEESCEYYKNLYEVMKEKQGVYHDRAEGLDRFIVKILRPIILREPENTNRKTFDIIKVQMDIITHWDTDRTQYIKDNKEEIVRKAIEKIAQDRYFKYYGVNVNVLALTKMLRLNDNMIELIFELKKDLKDIFKKDGDREIDEDID